MTYIYIFLAFFILILVAIAIDELIYKRKVSKRIKNSEYDQRFKKPNNTKWWNR